MIKYVLAFVGGCATVWVGETQFGMEFASTGEKYIGAVTTACFILLVELDMFKEDIIKSYEADLNEEKNTAGIPAVQTRDNHNG